MISQNPARPARRIVSLLTKERTFDKQRQPCVDIPATKPIAGTMCDSALHNSLALDPTFAELTIFRDLRHYGMPS